MIQIVKVLRELFGSIFVDFIKEGVIPPVFIDILILILLTTILLIILKNSFKKLTLDWKGGFWLFIIYSTLYFNYVVFDFYIMELFLEYKKYNIKSIDFMLFELVNILRDADIFAYIFVSLILILIFVLFYVFYCIKKKKK